MELNCDCLGCLFDALQTGEITEEEYEDIVWFQEELDSMKTVQCTSCKLPAYISMYEPDLAHCPDCGMYSHLDPLTMEWSPLRQGTPMGGRS